MGLLGRGSRYRTQSLALSAGLSTHGGENDPPPTGIYGDYGWTHTGRPAALECLGGAVARRCLIEPIPKAMLTRVAQHHGGSRPAFPNDVVATVFRHWAPPFVKRLKRSVEMMTRLAGQPLLDLRNWCVRPTKRPCGAMCRATCNRNCADCAAPSPPWWAF
jgi:hypothetical protein